ncbi:catalase/peroxidase HPI [Mangrovimicrobium sediminis]|uniref:Catalase-peroxidase n=1 Tax=Mangrovimicrobium sediminis TaxID=2562682 RepID=A0A4Z0M0E7_9GAMM|nr:catalase/peroxidase HPI [Haliea sp. SAOS-164]TGD72765.1 catalase/peroxidase HPI [Haliea sp. SAOS-164]
MKPLKTVRKAITVATLCALGATAAATHAEAPDNDYWWPNRLSLEPLRDASASADPMGADFDYAEAFETLDVKALEKDLRALMKDSQDWWPADFGHYGPFFIRMSWHAAGTYRTIDGRGGADGGMQRFAPLNSWPDNASLDKARRLLWPIKEKYGNAVSWADLIVLAGNMAMDDMGFKTLGFAFGRADEWQPEDVNWGPEGEWLTDQRRNEMGRIEGPFGATEMGLIYVNPEGPHKNPDPLKAAQAIRDAFGRMAMNDEETAALIAGGHTFGKAHGAHKAADCVGPEPEAAPLEQQGLGWANKCGTGKGSDAVTSGLEGAWTINPVQWTHNYLQNLYGFEWELHIGPGGAQQWRPVDGQGASLVPDAHDPDKRHAPMMFTTDIALKEDPSYRKITQRWLENPEEFEQAYARAWFKLIHRDMGPASRYLGPWAPEESFIWQDPVPEADYKQVSDKDISRLKSEILDTGLSVGELVRTAWASASTFRETDMRGGANGARIRLMPQKDWAVNEPADLAKVLAKLEKVQADFNKKSRKTKVSLADVIVLGGAAAIEKAAADAGYKVSVPFVPGRTDATQEMTEVASFTVLEPKSDGFRNYHAASYDHPPAQALVEKAALLDLTVPEMTALVGGMRVLGANVGGNSAGVFTDEPGKLTTDFFVNLVDMSTKWQKASTPGLYEGVDRDSGEVKWTATPVDLIFGSNSELRAIAEFYAMDDSKKKFVDDFIAAWTKVMTADRFDV